MPSARLQLFHVARSKNCFTYLLLAEHHVQCVTVIERVVAEDIANLGVCNSVGLQALVGETKVHVWQTGDTL